MGDILLMTATVFVTQIIFIWARTWNVRSISDKKMNQVLMSGAIVHIAWLVSITLGVVSFKEIMLNFQWQYLPVIVGSLTGGLIGSYLGLKAKLKK